VVVLKDVNGEVVVVSQVAGRWLLQMFLAVFSSTPLHGTWVYLTTRTKAQLGLARAASPSLTMVDLSCGTSLEP